MRRITLRFICYTIGLFVCFILLAFSMSNLGDHTSIREFQPVPIKCDCPLQQEVVPKIIPKVPTVIPTVPTVTPAVSTVTASTISSETCNEVQKTSPVQRAIIIYYPHHQSEYFFPEVRW